LALEEVWLLEDAMGFQPVRKARLYEQVTSQIERMIVQGQLVDGELLPAEKELMSRFNVSRATLREALLSLQQKGIIDIRNGERARVTKSNMDKLVSAMSGAVSIYLSEDEGVHRFQALRKTLEVAIVRTAAMTATSDELEQISAALEKNRAAKGNNILFSQTDVIFHLEIIRVSRNPLLVGIYQALTGWLTEQRKQVLEVQGAEETAFTAHSKIFMALVDRNKDRAEEAMAEHIDTVISLYWSQVEQSRVEAA
jgi:GntR family transcriptional regulator, sialic acid-inducible nan operon repressor